MIPVISGILLVVFLLLFIVIIWEFQTGGFSNWLFYLTGGKTLGETVKECNSFSADSNLNSFCCLDREIAYKDEKSGKFIRTRMTCKQIAENNPGEINEMNCGDC